MFYRHIQDFIPIWQEEQIYIYMQEKTRSDIFISYRNRSESKIKEIWHHLHINVAYIQTYVYYYYPLFTNTRVY